MLTDHLRLGPVTFRSQTYSPETLTKQIDQVATYLDEQCRGRSPIVYLQAINHVKTIAGYFGIIKSGRACLLVDPATRALEWAEMIRGTPPSAVIRFDESTDVLDTLREISLFDNMLDESALRELDGVCTLLYTAADDGYAKAAMLTHENMLANARAVVECFCLSHSTASCSLVPMSHLFALQTGLIAPVLCGAPVCLIDADRFTQVRSVIVELSMAKVERLCSVPPLLHLLAKAWVAGNIERLPAIIVTGGSKLQPELLD